MAPDDLVDVRPERRDLRLLDVELVLDLADDLLDHVLQRDDAGDAAVLVEHRRHVHALGAHAARACGRAGSVSGTNEIARATSVSDCRRLGGAEQVLDVDQPDHVVEVALARAGSACGRLRRAMLQVLFHRARGREVDHVGARHHDLARDAVRELEDVVEQLALLARAARSACSESSRSRISSSLWRSSPSVTGAMPTSSQHAVGGVVEQPDHRVGHLVEDVERQRHPAATVGSGLRMAIDFGACSPSTMWRTVMTQERDGEAHRVEHRRTARRRCRPAAARSSRANAGSPTQPSARLASVMPSWRRRQVGVEVRDHVRARAWRGDRPRRRAARSASAAP